MLRIFISEFYKAFHNRTFCAAFAIIIVLSIPMYNFQNIMRSEAHDVIAFDYNVDENIKTASLQGWSKITNLGYYSGMSLSPKKYYFDVEAETLLKPDGILYEEFGWMLQEKPEYLQVIFGAFYPMGAENVVQDWRLKRVLNEFAPIILTGLVIVIFFLGKDFTNRGYSACIMSGNNRTKVFFAKLFACLTVSSILSITLLAVGIICFNPNVFVLGHGYVFRCIITRVFMDIGFLSLSVIFPFIFKDIVKSLTVGFLFIMLFTKLFANNHILESFNNEALWSYEFMPGAFLSMSLASIGIFLLEWGGSYIIFRRAQLK